jgi:hypothetical protein
VDRSRRPHNCSHATVEPIENAILVLRAKHPSWGARKLKARLEMLQPDGVWPAASSKDERTVTTACPQLDTENGLQRSTDLEGQTRAQLIMARRANLPLKIEYTCVAQTCLSTNLSLTVPRRTRHSRYLPSSQRHCGLICFLRVRNG